MTCPICGAKVKNPDSSSHIRSKRHQQALGQKTTPEESIVKDVEPLFSPDAIENRISSLEAQVSTLASDLTNLKTKVAGLTPLSERSREDMLERAKRYRMKPGGE